MLNFFPEIYPEETLYSVFARYHVMSGNISKFETIKDLFGVDTKIAVLDFPSGLDFLCGELKSPNITPMYLIEHHTILPIFKPFVSNTILEYVINDMKKGNGGLIHKRLGIMAGGICKKKVLKYCPQCVVEDRLLFKRAYLHRNHQVPGNFICSKHKLLLNEYSLSYKDSKFEFIDINKLDLDLNHKFIKDDRLFSELLNLALDIDSLLKSFNEPLDKIETTRRYISKLQNDGLASCSGIVKKKKLFASFESYYTNNILEMLESVPNPENENGWLSKISTMSSKEINPIRHLLFIRFLFGGFNNFLTNVSEYKPFGQGPWPCLNPVCKNYLKDVINECSVEYNKSKPYGIFKCLCGFTYVRKGPDVKEEKKYVLHYRSGRIYEKFFDYGPLWENEFKEKIISRQYSQEKLASYFKRSIPSIIELARVRGLDQYLNTVIAKQNINKESRLEKFEKLCSSYKKDLLDFLSTNPLMTRDKYPKYITAKINWLKKYEKEWLKTVLPHPQKYRVKKNKRKTINWCIRDEVISKRVIEAINNIKQFEKPTQITLSLISKMIGISLYEKLEKLPKTKSIIVSNIETKDDFHMRKIQLTIQRNIINKKITKTYFIHNCGLCKRSKKVDQYLNNIVKNLN